MMKTVRLGTRSSPLALWQANETARQLGLAGYDVRIVPMRTAGDRRLDVPLADIGGKGLFVKELEEALDRDEIDLAVHSLKDVPSLIPDRFVLAGFLEREDPRDAWLNADGLPIEALPRGAVVATSAPRRRAQLFERHPHLLIAPLRGNVETRVAKMRERLYDGIVLAGAGLLRLGRSGDIVRFFSVDEMVPAAGQGIIGLETLRTNAIGREAAASINDSASSLAAMCERGVLQQFGTRLDCNSCVAVHASRDGGEIIIRAFLADFDGANALRVTRSGSDAHALVRTVAEELIGLGAIRLLEAASI